MLRASDAALQVDHDLLMLDLDGVVYVDGEAVPGAAEALAGARRAGAHVAFVTNNASRSPATVAEHLTSLGVEAAADDVVTSSQAAAQLLADDLGPGGRVLAVGGPGMADVLRDAGLDVVGPDDDPQAALTGYGADVRWSELMRVALLVRDGLPWVASNTDRTFPTRWGSAPGHGVQVQMLRDFTGVEPRVAGKPAPPLLRETVRRVGGERPLMVGDRLDTDIAGARRPRAALPAGAHRGAGAARAGRRAPRRAAVVRRPGPRGARRGAPGAGAHAGRLAPRGLARPRRRRPARGRGSGCGRGLVARRRLRRLGAPRRARRARGPGHAARAAGG